MQENEWSSSEDWSLAEAAGRGDESAYSVLIDRHQNAIHSFVFRSIGQEETSRDLTQEVFVRAWFALSKTSRKAKFTTWLFQIALNICRDHVKSKAGQQDRVTVSLVKESEDSPAELQEPASAESAPDKILEQAEISHLMENEIRKLPTELLQPFLLGAVEGFPYKEIAEILGLSAKAVEVRIYRARKLLAERLEHAGLVLKKES